PRWRPARIPAILCDPKPAEGLERRLLNPPSRCSPGPSWPDIYPSWSPCGAVALRSATCGCGGSRARRRGLGVVTPGDSDGNGTLEQDGHDGAVDDAAGVDRAPGARRLPAPYPLRPPHGVHGGPGRRGAGLLLLHLLRAHHAQPLRRDALAPAVRRRAHGASGELRRERVTRAWTSRTTSRSSSISTSWRSTSQCATVASQPRAPRRRGTTRRPRSTRRRR